MIGRLRELRWWVAIGLLVVWIVAGCAEATVPSVDRLLVLQEQDGRVQYSEWVFAEEPEADGGKVRRVRFLCVEHPDAILIRLEPNAPWQRIDGP